MGNDERYGYILDGDYHVLCSLEIDVFRSAARQLDKLPVDAATQVSHLWYILPNGVKPLGLEDAAELEGWCRDVHAGLLVYVPSEDGRLGSFIRRTSGAAMTSARGARQGPTPQKKGKRKPRATGVGTPCRATQSGQYASSEHGRRVKPSYTRTPLGPELTSEERKKKWLPPVRDKSRFSGTRASRHSAYPNYNDPEYDSHDEDW